MKMIEARKVIPLIRLILFGNPNVDEICKTAQELVDLHAIEAEPVKHGRWDSSGRYRFENDELAVVCSECNCAISEKEYQECNWFYCPVCGAKMDLEG